MKFTNIHSGEIDYDDVTENIEIISVSSDSIAVAPIDYQNLYEILYLEKSSLSVSGKLPVEVIKPGAYVSIKGKRSSLNSKKIKGTFEGKKIQTGSPGNPSPSHINFQGNFVMTKQ